MLLHAGHGMDGGISAVDSADATNEIRNYDRLTGQDFDNAVEGAGTGQEYFAALQGGHDHGGMEGMGDGHGGAAGHADNADLQPYSNDEIATASETLAYQQSPEQAIQSAEELGFSDAYGMSAEEFYEKAMSGPEGLKQAFAEIGIPEDKLKEGGLENLDPLAYEKTVTDYMNVLSVAPHLSQNTGGESENVGRAMIDSYNRLTGSNLDPNGANSFRGNDRKGEQDGTVEFLSTIGDIAAGNGFDSANYLNADTQGTFDATMVDTMDFHDSAGGPHYLDNNNGNENFLFSGAHLGHMNLDAGNGRGEGSGRDTPDGADYFA